MGITGIATLAYLLMFTGAGRMWVEEVPGTFSPVYWGRYVDWVLTTPLMLWDILALAGAPSDEIAMVLIMDMLMIGFGCAGAQTPDQKQMVLLHLRYGHFHPHRRRPLEVLQSQQVRRRSTCSLQQGCMDDHRLVDPLPNCLDRC